MSLSSLKRKVLNRGALYISLFKLRPLLKRLNQDSLVIDCGANVGDITAQFLKTGATVHSFEPDPTAYQRLTNRFTSKDKVTLHNKAAWIENTTLDLFFHKDSSGGGEDEFTVSSSVVDNKINIDTSKATKVPAIDLAQFVLDCPQRIAILKMDIEGAEIPILHHFIATEAYQKIDLMLVETHETKIPGHVEEVAKLKAIFKEKGIDHIKLNWI